MLCKNCGEKTEDRDFCDNCSPKIEDPKVEEPKVDDSKIDELVVDGPKVDEPLVDGPKADEPKIDGPIVDAPLVHETKVEDPKPPAISPKNLKIILIILTLAVIGGVGIAVAGTLGPLRNLERAVSATQNEINTRINYSPFAALQMLYAMADNSTIGFDISYQGFRVDGEFHNIAASNESALDATITLFLFPVSVEMVLNMERAAFRTSLLGNNFYGVYLDSFRQDFNQFGSMIELDQYTIDDVSSFVEHIVENMHNPPLEDWEELTAPAIDIFLNAERSISSNVATFTITENEIIEYLQAIMPIMEDIIRSMPFPEGESPDDMITEMRNDIYELEQNLTANLDLSFYMAGNRITRFDLTGIISEMGEPENIQFSIDFGNSINDDWVLESLVDGEPFQVVWSYDRTDTIHTNTILIAAPSEQDYSMAFLYNSATGDFSIYADDLSVLEGSFVRQNNDFEFRVDHYGARIRINATHGTAQMPDISFVPMSQWDMDFLNRIDNLIWQLQLF